ncbi:MAG: transposase [Bacteroidales bacterium]|nr:transposase [Bacteroidales bacterium]
MSEKYKVRNPEGLYFVTFTVVNWIDVFVKSIYKHLLINSLKYCQENKGLVVYAYVIMSSHIHAIFSSKDGFALEETIRDFKKKTSKEIIKLIKEYPESRRDWLLRCFKLAADKTKRGVNYKVWQDGFHPIELDSNQKILQRLEYIHQNTVKEEIVMNVEDYRYSSAVNYADGIGELEVDKLL